MPLIHSSSKQALKTNIGTLMDDVGKSPHVQSRDQALAIAYETKRRAGRATGGGLPHIGPIKSAVPGRTDHHEMDVPAGAYVIPADVVNHLGQDNTEAGLTVLHRMFGAPAQTSATIGSGGMPVMSDRGGARGQAGGAVPIMAAGGEYVIAPEQVARLGGGDLNQGHKILDKWVVQTRKKHVKTLQKLPGPAKS